MDCPLPGPRGAPSSRSSGRDTGRGVEAAGGRAPHVAFGRPALRGASRVSGVGAGRPLGGSREAAGGARGRGGGCRGRVSLGAYAGRRRPPRGSEPDGRWASGRPAGVGGSVGAGGGRDEA